MEIDIKFLNKILLDWMQQYMKEDKALWPNMAYIGWSTTKNWSLLSSDTITDNYMLTNWKI